ncbi:MAG: ATP-dependent helicase [Bacteroidia bacterium]|nr:ATP-dependent helicase [Bacteroidia bacterium]
MNTHKFEEEYKKLNQRQKKAVEAIEGPVMVIAGPGTGKTQVLSMRIGNILRKACVDPQNILCLTYTDAASIAMRMRLRYLIGAEAEKVKIATFHSFCNELILNNPEIFPDFEHKTVLDELTKIKILRQIIDKQPYNHPVKSPNNPYAHLKRLSNLLDTLIKESISLEELRKAIDKEKEQAKYSEEFLYTQNTNGYKKGDLNERKYQEYCQKLENTYKAAECIIDYHQLLKENNLYTFDDMINEVLKAFEENPDFLSDCQEQFMYILVDEYQDTSGSQQKILNYLTAFWGDQSNIFVVGDEDQSIFRFQGANLKNMMDFIERYKNSLQIIVLQDNYRSTQSILDAAYTILEENKERLSYHGRSAQDPKIEAILNDIKKDKKRLLAKGQTIDIKPTLITVQDTRLEDAFIVHEIQEIQKKQPQLPLSEIAVLAPKNDNLKSIANMLKALSIPYQIRRDVNILEHYLIKHLLDILYYINPAAKGLSVREDLLFRILMNPLWQLDWIDIQKLCFTKHKNLHNNPEHQTSAQWIEYLDSPQLLQSIGIHDYERLYEVGQKIKRWKWIAICLPITEVLQTIVYEGGFVSYAVQHPDKEELLLVLDSFFEYTQTWVQRYPKKNFSQWIEDIKEHEDFDVPIRMSNWLGKEKGVFLSTYHSAKGLEFEHVYLIRCDKSSWESKSHQSFVLPKILASKIKDEQADTEEKRRLFFVGMTRAKKYLNIVFSKNESTPKKKTQKEELPWYSLLSQNSELIEKRTISIPEEDILKKIAEKFQSAVLPKPNLSVNQDIVEIYQKSFTLSASHLNTYRYCKRKFYYQHILRVPTAPHHAVVYGTAIHAACKAFLEQLRPQNIPPKSLLLDLFTESLYSQKFMLTPQQYKDRLEQGQKELGRFYEYYSPKWEKMNNILPEQRIEIPYYSFQAGLKTTLVGIIDTLFESNSKFTLIDYKTGRLDKEDILPVSFNVGGKGDYWWQIAFYAYLAQKKNYPIEQAKIYFFREASQNGQKEDSNTNEVEINLGNGYQDMVEEAIQITLKGIKNGDFECVDGLEVKKKCKNCSYYQLCW